MLIVNDDPFGKFGLGAKRLWRRGAVPLVIGACCFAFALGGEAARDWGSYDRAGLANGQVWRLITAHLVHLGWAHLWPNLLALLLIGGLLEEFLSPVEWTVASLVTGFAISTGLYLFQPDTHWYVGLSGVLHGSWRAGPSDDPGPCGGARRRPRSRAHPEAALGRDRRTVPLTPQGGGAVVVAAHLYGAIAGRWPIRVAVMRWRTLPETARL